MTPLGLTVAVKCRNDYRVLRLLESVDEDVERIVLVDPEEPRDLLRRVQELGASYITVPVNDIGLRCNTALERARNDRVLLVDADCVLQPGALRRAALAMQSHAVVRIDLEFAHGRSRTAGAIAEWRRWENQSAPLPAFMPGLGIDRVRLAAVLPGSPVFPVGLPAAVDAAFDARLVEAGVRVHRVHGPGLVHDPITPEHFLRSALRTGSGTARLVARGERSHQERFVWDLTKAARLKQLRTFWSWQRLVGLEAAVAGAAWHVTYRLGYHIERGRR